MTTEPEYTLRETYDQLDGFLHRGERMYPIDVAYSAAHWLEEAGQHSEALAALYEWLQNEEPDMPLMTAADAFDALGELLGVP